MVLLFYSLEIIHAKRDGSDPASPTLAQVFSNASQPWRTCALL